MSIDSFVNTNILKHPLNWLVVWSMVLILAFVTHLVFSHLSGVHPGLGGVADSDIAGGPGTTTDVSNPAATS